ITGTGASPSLTHSTTVTLVVNSTSSQDFSISATPSSRAVAQGNPTSYAVTVTPSGNFSGTVSLRVDGLPTGATATFSPGSITGFNGTVRLSVRGLPFNSSASFNPGSLTGQGTSTLTVSTNTSTSTGTFTLGVRGTSGSVTHSTTVQLVVQ